MQNNAEALAGHIMDLNTPAERLDITPGQNQHSFIVVLFFETGFLCVALAALELTL